ncbi:cleavage and polyadenylation specificity factor subunit 4-like protein [Dinothrombium tinctorium]|uniref:Cleavage and polyadenylation specificity factor subunit 4 n=1 Tax=Dinothrombium tinctorium TaxID=1965070 RepID=A0A3S3SLV2_9ACAR|nr:cleavage and polyadenylation specificity factor subunit 4-like protein [Dinothrombium tinctorium]
MEEILASVEDMEFDVEQYLEEQLGSLDLPFPGMDKSGAAVCVYHLKGKCQRGVSCPYRHIKGDRTIVCKHWLRGLCKKGDGCEFLHEYDMTKMPECYFYSRFHACSNKECPFLHIDPESKIKDCPWYDRGFCRHGPNCRHRHTRRILCLNYLSGFCPEGPNCKYVHPRFDLPINDPSQQVKKGTVICHFCNEIGHKIYNCPKMPVEAREEAIQNKLQQLEAQSSQNQTTFKTIDSSQIQRESQQQQQQQKERQHRPLDQVTCFKCGEKGHYANKCPKGHLAFLSSALKELQSKRDPNASS